MAAHVLGSLPSVLLDEELVTGTGCGMDLATDRNRGGTKVHERTGTSVDDTLLDNDHIKTTSESISNSEFGATCRDRYWKILETLFEELGYRDYLGALQRYRIEHPFNVRSLRLAQKTSLRSRS
jgi:hypothetical protein